MHKKGICHNDLKLENILLNHDGSISICDFVGSTKHGTEYNITFVTNVPPEFYRDSIRWTSDIDLWCIGDITMRLIIGQSLYI